MEKGHPAVAAAVTKRHSHNNNKNHNDRSKKSSSSYSSSIPDRSSSNRKLSHALSWALRHQALDLGLTIREDGYVPVQEILDSSHPRLKGVTLEQIQDVVQTNNKQRFKLEHRPRHLYYPNSCENTEEEENAMTQQQQEQSTASTILCIRANQGHSINLINPELLLTLLSLEELNALPCIVHGTYPAAWNSIREEGLKKMGRTHIHCAPGLPQDDGVISGMRKSATIYIYVNPSKCAENGIEFFISDNGVILTEGVAGSGGTLPTDFFSHVTDSAGNILLDNRQQQP
jgi:2'-phosphotransferase